MKMMGVWVLLAAGCSSPASTGGVGAVAGDAAVPAEAEAGAAKCIARSGVYQFADALFSGNCGPASQPTSFSVSDSTQTFAMPYVIAERLGAGGKGNVSDFVHTGSGSVTVSADNCQIDYSITLPNEGAPGTFQKVGVATWAPDANSAKTTEDYTSFTADGSATCTGRYKPIISR